MVQRHSVVALCLVTIGIFGQATTVYGDCLTPNPHLSWHYPGDGQTQISLNASVWVLAQGNILSVQLDGEYLSKIVRDVEPGGVLYRSNFGLATLEPNTTYTLTIAISNNNGVDQNHISTFTTGEEQMDTPLRQPWIRHYDYDGAPDFYSRPADDDPRSESLLFRGACYASNDPVYGTFDISPNALINRVEFQDGKGGSYYWPAQFGAVRLLTTESIIDEGVCFKVHAYDETGAHQVSEVVCSDTLLPGEIATDPTSLQEAAPPFAENVGESCSTALPKTPSLANHLILFNLLFFTIVRRKRS